MSTDYPDLPVSEYRSPGEPAKSNRGGWYAPVVAVCEDGSEHSTTVNRRLKRELVAYLATLPAKPERPTAICFDSEGAMIGTRTTFDLTGGRL
jgi:hypothetical protein